MFGFLYKKVYNKQVEKLKEAEIFCICCGYKTLYKKNDYEICSVCFWQDDILDEKEFSGANGMNLSQAKRNFIKFGACSKEMIKNVLPKKIVKKYGRK